MGNRKKYLRLFALVGLIDLGSTALVRDYLAQGVELGVVTYPLALLINLVVGSQIASALVVWLRVLFSFSILYIIIDWFWENRKKK